MKVQFPAMRGVIGKNEYYSTLMALSEIPRFFKFNDWGQVDPAARAQRVLNVARIPEITQYILDNEDGYLFSSITVSYSCPVTFIPSEQNEQMGVLEMDLEEMQFIINDGQHRSAAITQALKQRPEIGKERISVLLFPTGDLDRLRSPLDTYHAGSQSGSGFPGDGRYGKGVHSVALSPAAYPLFLLQCQQRTPGFAY